MSSPDAHDGALDALRVVTYNVHQCIGRDGRLDPRRIGRVLRHLQPDIVALQEVDTGLDERTDLGQLDVLARVTGLEPIVGPTVEREHGFFGNAILSRFEARSVRRVDLSVDGYEPRIGLDAALSVAGSTVRVFATHLGLSARERRVQIGRILSYLYRRPRGRVTVVAGDFNEWFDWSRNVRRLNSYLGWQPRRSTYPSRRPLFALDRIWVAPKAALRASGVDRSDEARAASDHLPVWANLELARL